ncbi:Lysozyme RrrD [Cupriavidus yeoncheonensis]|uniref:Lysozyme n=1 Tax=Cupriavidus yeoncheonensis TaxID=1462994 RepID=A0A916N4Q9_9BURK|nr:lysozyme [Cupriavidus yeoncheonensis]CAG2144480.1 Lysozyme RrrD [Cupriavidus yeoncheonensis]
MNKRLVAAVGAGCATLLTAYVPQFEGMVLRGYRDPIGIVTACAGHTATAVLGKPYTRAECEQLLADDLVEHAQGVQRCVTAPMSTGQRAAFVSFAFNVGTPKFCGSSMARKANAGDMAGACAELSRWTYAGGKVLPGLVKRRETERAICEGKLA